MTTKNQKKTATSNESAKPAAMAAPVKTMSTAPTAAATHKAPARQTVAPAATVTPVAERKAAFDARAQHPEIEREAYGLWETGGCKHGQADKDWLRAVEVVRARYA